MDKKNKGLVDNHDGDIILNESGTSVNFGWDTKENDTNDEATAQQQGDEEKNKPSGNTDKELTLPS